MEEQKYFTPNVEDFHKGYEYEILELHRENYHVGFNNIISKWIPKKWDSSQIRLNKLACKITSKEIRVPYLTKEQIENEGWKFTEQIGNTMFFKKKDFELTFNTDRIEINNIGEYDLGYWGKCKDVNIFRYLMKLLEI